jgi:hypothetical protein
MNAQPQSRRELWWAFLIIAGAALLGTTNDSFWMDEMNIGILCSAQTPLATWKWMELSRVPEIQAPLYMIYMWVWVHAFGNGEWVLRLASVPWFVFGACVFAHYIGRAAGSVLVAGVVAAFNAFAWYYLNETRVYAMQLGLALGTLACAVEVVRTTIESDKPNGAALRLLAFFLVLLCASTVLGALCGAIIFLAVFLCLPPKKWLEPFRSAPIAALVSGVALLGLAYYYHWTRSTGARPTDVGTTNLQTAVFVVYELLGLSGLGPGRIALRAQGVAALKPYLPQLVVFSAAAGFLVWQGVRELRARMSLRRILLLATLAAAPALLIMAVGVAIHFRVLGRHLTPLAPIFLTLLVLGIIRTARGPRWQQTVPVMFLSLALASCLFIRFAERHRKDDFRSALQVARESLNQGKVVWWNGDVTGPMYYKVPIATLTNRAGVYSLQNPNPELLKLLPQPDVIVGTTKRESYDVAEAIPAYMERHGYRRIATFQAFEVWERSSSGKSADQ